MDSVLNGVTNGGTGAALGFWAHWLLVQLPELFMLNVSVLGGYSLFLFLRFRQRLDLGLLAPIGAVHLLGWCLIQARPSPELEAMVWWDTVGSLIFLVALAHWCTVVYSLPARKWMRLMWWAVGMWAALLALALVNWPSSGAAGVLRSQRLMPVVVLGLVLAAVLLWQGAAQRQWELLGFVAVLLSFGLADLAHLFLAWPSLGAKLWPWSAVALLFVAMYKQSHDSAVVQRALFNAQTHLQMNIAEAEAKLEQSFAQLREQEQKHALAQERLRLMQDMHDGMGSSLHSAVRVCEAADLDQAELAALLEDCLADMQMVVDSRESLDADLALLLAMVRSRQQSRIEAAGLDLHWEVTPLPALPWLNAATNLHVLRILQAALSNCLQHANATQLWVSTFVVRNGVAVRIKDNGVGFEWADVRAIPGKGLSSLQKRAGIIGGQARWRSSAAGTSFTLWLPLQK